MITILTQTAITVINDIANLSFSNHSEQYSLTSEELNNLLSQLEKGNIIRRQTSGYLSEKPNIYELTRSKNAISLLDVLEATGEHINCNHPISEDMYTHFHNVAPRLGVLNQFARTYLSQIRLTDF